MKGSTVNLRWQKKESVNLKIDQNKVSNLQNREKKEEEEEKMPMLYFQVGQTVPLKNRLNQEEIENTVNEFN